MMMNQTERRNLRARVIDKIEELLEVEGFEVVGQTSQGVAYRNEDEDVFVVSMINKKEDFDVEEAVAQEQEKRTKAEQKAKEKAEKKAKREKKKEEEGE